MSEKIALYTFVPSFCPNCGIKTEFLREPSKGEQQSNIYPNSNRRTNNSYFCKNCGLYYSLADRTDVIEAATKSGSDLQEFM